MSRLTRLVVPGVLHHVTQRGVLMAGFVLRLWPRRHWLARAALAVGFGATVAYAGEADPPSSIAATLGDLSVSVAVTLGLKLEVIDGDKTTSIYFGPNPQFGDLAREKLEQMEPHGPLELRSFSYNLLADGCLLPPAAAALCDVQGILGPGAKVTGLAFDALIPSARYDTALHPPKDSLIAEVTDGVVRLVNGGLYWSLDLPDGKSYAVSCFTPILRFGCRHTVRVTARSGYLVQFVISQVPDAAARREWMVLVNDIALKILTPKLE